MNNKKKIILTVVVSTIVLAVIVIFVSLNSGISGTYESENGYYSVEFMSLNKCTWYQDGIFFNGTYEKADSGYQLEIVGTGGYLNTNFTAVKEGRDLIITGGIVGGERFMKK